MFLLRFDMFAFVRLMTKRREVTFETEVLIVDRPNRGKDTQNKSSLILFRLIAEVEVLCGRAARMAYLTEYELEQLIAENRFILDSMPVFSRDSLPVHQSASVHSVTLGFLLYLLIRTWFTTDRPVSKFNRT